MDKFYLHWWIHVLENSCLLLMSECSTLQVITMSFNTNLQLQWKGCHNMLQQFWGDSLHTFHNLLFQVISIGRTCFIYLAFDVTPEEVVWYCKIR